MSNFNSINDAVRARIDEAVAEKSLNQADYPYTSDAAESLNQLASIMGSESTSSSIADSLYECLGVSGSGGDIMSQVNWVQAVSNATCTLTDSPQNINTVPHLLTLKQLQIPYAYIRCSINGKEFTYPVIYSFTLVTDDPNIPMYYNINYKDFDMSIDDLSTSEAFKIMLSCDVGATLVDEIPVPSTVNDRAIIVVNSPENDSDFNVGDTVTVNVWLGSLPGILTNSGASETSGTSDPPISAGV